MEFNGHFTGTFGSAKGQGHAIDFIVTEVLKVTDGRITDSWHVEDNLTLLSQMGVATLARGMPRTEPMGPPCREASCDA